MEDDKKEKSWLQKYREKKYNIGTLEPGAKKPVDGKQKEGEDYDKYKKRQGYKDGGVVDKRSKAERIAEIVRRRTGPSEETKKLAMDWSEGTALEEMREEKGGVPSHEKMTNFEGISKMLKEKKKK